MNETRTAALKSNPPTNESCVMSIQNIRYDLINNEQYIVIMEYAAAVGTVFSFVGVISNIINISAFVFMGLNDGMTLCFLALSIFDLAYVCFSFSLGISVSLGVIELKTSTRFPIDPYAVSTFLANFMILINVTNVLTTTFLAVARCMCVAKPFQFKNTFTRRRTSYFLFGFVIFASAIYVPIFNNMGIAPQFIEKDNITRPTLWLSSNRQSIKVIIWVIIDMILPITTQFIVLVCVLVMANSLRASSKFRQTSMLASTKVGNKDHNTDDSCKRNKNYSSKISSSICDKIPDKDIRVVQQVVLISLVYAICNTPKVLLSVIGASVLEFAPGRQYNNLYLNVNILRKHFEAFNAAINTAIYYRYNTKFRAIICIVKQ